MADKDWNSAWIHLGAIALGISGLLFGGFPLVRPFFDDMSRDPTAAANTMAAPTWYVSHLMLIAGLVLLPIGLLATARASGPGHGRVQLLGALLTLVGAGLFLPVGGVEAFALPAIARLYLEGNTGALAAIDAAHRALQTSVFAPALALLGLGGIVTAIAVSRSRSYPTWAAVALAFGLVSFMPLLPQSVRIVDGLVIALGATRLASGVWQVASARGPDSVAPEL